jgi:hypothetical protein
MPTPRSKLGLIGTLLLAIIYSYFYLTIIIAALQFLGITLPETPAQTVLGIWRR